MKLSTKTSFNLNQIKVSLSKGLPYIEFHTEYSDFQKDIDFQKIRDLLDENNVSCLTVHSPITDNSNNFDTISLGTLYKENRRNNIELYKKCIIAANILSSSSNPVVVAHIGTGYNLNDSTLNNLSEEDIQKILNEAKDDLTEINSYIDENYPGTIFAVENMPHFSYNSKGDMFGWYFGTGHDLPIFIEQLDLPNIKTCLDICHIQMSIAIDKLSNPYKNNTVTDYIKSYANSIGLVHLNKAVGLGERQLTHSQPYDPNNEEDLNILSEIISCFYENNYSCPITLEINDTDYSKQLNTDLMIQSLVKVYKLNKEPSLYRTLTNRNIINIKK
ncbi:TIM barrel protein (plasmid) [Clostridium perfringens]